MSDILILSQPEDDHATAVMAALRCHHGVTAHLVDLSRFPRVLAAASKRGILAVRPRF